MKQAIPTTALLITVFFIALTHSSAGFAYSICLSASSDDDNDGWGWENNSPCIVENSNASQAVANFLLESFPACTTVEADPDGDGWGFENSRSCFGGPATDGNATTLTAPVSISNPVPLITGTLSPSGAGSSTNVNSAGGLLLSSFPVCSTPLSDADNGGWGFEYGQSCRSQDYNPTPVTTTTTAVPTTPAVPETPVIPETSVMPVAPVTPVVVESESTPPANTADHIYNQNFSDSNLGLYQGDQLNRDWATPYWHHGLDEGRVRIVDTGGVNGKAMEVTYPARTYGANGATAFLSDVHFGMGLPSSYEELFLAYDIRFDDDFEFILGGKLPGLCGAANGASLLSGCNTGGGIPTGYDGWSARGLWTVDGGLQNYVYHASQEDRYGDNEDWGVFAIPGVWHRVEHRVVLNTPGRKNGILEAWFDGTKVLSLNDLEYRKTSSIGINLFYFSTFFGGNNASWAPATDQKMNFDNFAILTDKIDPVN